MRRSTTKSRLARSAASVLEMLEQRMLFNATATLVKTDSLTEGTWTGKYGADGYSVVGGNTSLPSYATISVAGDQFYEWEAPGTSDPRALQTSTGSSTRVAATDFSNSGSFTIDVNVTDNQTHQVSLYLLDGDNQNRSETVTATDPSTNTVLASTDVTHFTSGEYVVFNVSGHVQFTITNDPGSLNAVMSGIFFDPGPGGPSGGGTSTVTPAASFISTDTATKGSWNGVYGSDGFSVVGGSTSLPSDATFSVTGDNFYEWEAPGTSDTRALQVTAGSTQRVAATDFSNSGSFTVNLDVNGTSQVALYVLDQDFQHRAETIQISNASTNAVLSTQNVSNFTGGEYLVYTISGDVNIQVINGAGSLNCVLSGIFFDNNTAAGGGGGTGGTDHTVGTGEQFSTIQAAVNASHSGDTIDVFSGTYKEQVVIPQGLNNLTLEAAKGATVFVEPPASMTATGAIIEVDGANNTTIQGFNVMGPGTTAGALKFGILVDGGASQANILNNNISNIGDSGVPSGNNGIGVAVTDGSASISGNIISSYQKAGVLIGLTSEVTGSPTWQQNAVVSNNVVTGVGADSHVSQYGIEFVGLRATGTAQNDRVSDNQFTGTIGFGNAGGILVYNAGQVTVISNIVSNNDTNIIIDGGQGAGGVPLGGSDFAIVSSNQVFSATVFDGIDLVDGVTKVTVAWNNSFNNATDGIFIDANTGGNTLTNNLVTDNKNFDIEDVTYSPSNYQGAPVYGTFNSYSMDQFGSSNDPSLPSTSFF